MREKVILIVGGTSGIGKSAADVFNSKGWSVIIAGRDVSRGNAILAQLHRDGSRHRFIRTDISSDEDVTNLFAEIRLNYEMLDAAFNSAGILGEPANIPNLTAYEFNRVIDINLIGTFRCLKHEISIMSNQKSGSIVNCSSIGGIVGMPGISPYVASKHAIIGLTKSAALEVSMAGVRVNCISPGATYTPMQESMLLKDNNLKANLEALHPLGRVANALEIANSVYWLASDDASFVTGSNLVVDGGFTIK